MYQKTVFFSIIIFLFSFFNLAHANLIINEIMYAPVSGSDYEWVEIFNSGSDPVDLNNYRFFHGANETESNSGPLTLRNGSTTVLQPSEYAIIAKSPSVVIDYTWLNFSGIIFSASTVSLPDSGDNTYIAISDPDKLILNYVKYDTSLGGNKDSGNSLSKIGGVWVGATPTPGIINKEGEEDVPGTPPVPDNTVDGGEGDNNSQNTTATEEKNKKSEELKIKIKIEAKSLVFAGTSALFNVNAFGYNKEKLVYGRFFLNFGDGDSKEMQASSAEQFFHAYRYPGD